MNNERRIAEEIIKAGQPSLRIRYGVIQSVESDGTITATIGGGTTSVPSISCIGPYVPQVGDNVVLIKNGGEYIALGIVPSNGGWHTPTLLNSWVNYDNTVDNAAAYQKVNDRVYVRGLVKNGSAANAVIMTLPAGYRPLREYLLTGIGNDLFAVIHVKVNGDVVATSGGSTTYTSLDSISFSTT